MERCEIKKIWEQAKDELKSTIPEHNFNNWIAPLEATGFENNEFSVITGQSFAIQVIRQNHLNEITMVLERLLGEKIKFNIIFDQTLAKKLRAETEKIKAKEQSIIDKKEKIIETSAYMKSSNLNLKYKFENFVVDENNKFAYAMATEVAKNPAQKYNPLFIYGQSGVGKTHLLQAIGHFLTINSPSVNPKYISTEDFINNFLETLNNNNEKTNEMAKFRRKYRNVDILLIDDIQMIEGKKRTVEELFNTFEALHNKNKQIVITADRLPKEMKTLPDRLRTRFEMGITVEITPPNFETRVKILKNLAQNLNLDVNQEVFEYIAKNFKKNVRELEGAFNNVQAFATIEKTPITLDLAQKILKCDSTKDLSLDSISKTVADFFNLTIKDLKSTKRNSQISTARQITIYLIRQKLDANYKEIADFLNKQHPTIIYSYEKIVKTLKTDDNLKNTIQTIENLF